MRNIQLTGFGNALVDVEFNVSEHELEAFGVTKGAMTLTDASRQREMISSLGEREAHHSSGGSVANSAIAYAQFGGASAFCSLLGEDDFGTFYANEFRDLGIELQAKSIGGAHTGSCLVLITPDSERTMNTTLGVNEAYSRNNVDEQLIARSEWIYLEGYKLTEESGFEAVDVAAFYAKKHGTNVAVSCSDSFIIDVFGDRLRSLLKQTDLIFCNEREGCALAGEEDSELAFRALTSRHNNVVFTKAERGSRIQWNGTECEIPAYAVKVIDTTGAGDMYAGAFLYGVLNRHHPEHAGRLAAYASAQVVAQYGARLKSDHIEVRDSILQQAEIVTPQNARS